jgi:hypothetical protein
MNISCFQIFHSNGGKYPTLETSTTPAIAKALAPASGDLPLLAGW